MMAGVAQFHRRTGETGSRCVSGGGRYLWFPRLFDAGCNVQMFGSNDEFHKAVSTE